MKSENLDRPAPPPARLTTARDVRRELARVYRETRSGELDPMVATKLVYMLEILRRAVELGDIEKRLIELEQQA